MSDLPCFSRLCYSRRDEVVDIGPVSLMSRQKVCKVRPQHGLIYLTHNMCDKDARLCVTLKTGTIGGVAMFLS